MSSLLSASRAEIFTLLGAIQRQLVPCASFEDAARRCVDLFYEHFQEDLVLARIYVSSPYRLLPEKNREFVDQLTRAKGLTLSDATSVLSLVATRGRQPAWNDPRQSAGHLGIPLASPDFITALPMIARLLSDFGVELHWIDRPERGISTTRSGWAGLFHVPDARTSRDQSQRLIIPAQDFVAEQAVQTVFGVGGSYTTGTLFTAIFFTRCTLSREIAQRYLPLITTFKSATAAYVEAGRIFSN